MIDTDTDSNQVLRHGTDTDRDLPRLAKALASDQRTAVEHDTTMADDRIMFHRCSLVRRQSLGQSRPVSSPSVSVCLLIYCSLSRRTEVPCLRTEVPCLRTEVPCLRTEVPCLRTEVPCLRTEVPCLRTWLPCLRTWVLSVSVSIIRHGRYEDEHMTPSSAMVVMRTHI
uniref:Uncharacterized protein n=1 Tax=Knipowitschia caucasica TaxID=637954 RepID=A0AAV2JWN1_KNICA